MSVKSFSLSIWFFIIRYKIFTKFVALTEQQEFGSIAGRAKEVKEPLQNKGRKQASEQIENVSQFKLRSSGMKTTKRDAARV